MGWVHHRQPIRVWWAEAIEAQAALKLSGDADRERDDKDDDEDEDEGRRRAAAPEGRRGGPRPSRPWV